MFEGIKALLNSEKALTGGVLIVAATVLVALGYMTQSEWKDYTLAIYVAYVGGKTIQGSVAALVAGKKPKSDPADLVPPGVTPEVKP